MIFSADTLSSEAVTNRWYEANFYFFGYDINGRLIQFTDSHNIYLNDQPDPVFFENTDYIGIIDDYVQIDIELRNEIGTPLTVFEETFVGFEYTHNNDTLLWSTFINSETLLDVNASIQSLLCQITIFPHEERYKSSQNLLI